MSVPACSKCVANEWRKVCTDTGLQMPASVTAFLSERCKRSSNRGLFLAALRGARKTGLIGRDPQRDDAQWRQRQRALYKHDWVVYAKTPLGGAAQTLEYLSRYTHRTAIGNQRIRRIDANGVAFTARADAKGGKRMVRLDGAEFVRRFMLHVLPTGLKRIRHYGLLASACKGDKLAKARAALSMPAPSVQALESATDFLHRVAHIDAAQCPTCKIGRLRVVETLAHLSQLAPRMTAKSLILLTPKA